MRNATQTTINNSTTETSALSLSIPANCLGTQGGLRAMIGGYYQNNSGAGDSIRIKVKFGGTVYQDDTIAGIPANAQSRSFFFETLLQNRGAATNLQGLVSHVNIGNVTTATAGFGSSLSAASYHDSYAYAFPGKDTAAGANTLDITFTLGTANGNITLFIGDVLLEML